MNLNLKDIIFFEFGGVGIVTGKPEALTIMYGRNTANVSEWDKDGRHFSDPTLNIQGVRHSVDGLPDGMRLLHNERGKYIEMNGANYVNLADLTDRDLIGELADRQGYHITN